MTKDNVLSKLLQWADRHNHFVAYYQGISEQGYTDKPMLCANWNPPAMHKISEWARGYFKDEAEVELGWSDEWMACSECGKAIRTSPDCYSWLPSYLWTGECSIACVECFESCQEDIIEYHRNDAQRAITPAFYPFLEKCGFVCYSPDEYCATFETGLHPGQNDDPKSVAKDIEAELPGYDYIFKVDSVGQFDLHWSVFLRKED